MHWLVIARPQGALGVGEPVAHYTGASRDFAGEHFEALHAHGLEPVWPPLVPARFGGEYVQPPYGATPGVMGGSWIGPQEPFGSLRWIIG